MFQVYCISLSLISSKKKTVKEIPLVSKEESLNNLGEDGEESVRKEDGECVAGEKGTTEDGEEGVAREGGEEGVTREGGEEGVAREGGEEGVTRKGGEEGVAREGGEEGVAREDGEEAETVENGEVGVANATKEEEEEGVVEEKREQDSIEEVVVAESIEGRTGQESGSGGLVASGSQTFPTGAGDTVSVSGSEGAGRGHPNHQPSCSSTDELLAIMGMDTTHRIPHPAHASQTVSESSGDNSFLLAEQPCFLHLKVSHKCSAAHTYTPVNFAVGIDIPQSKAYQPPRGFLQQVRTTFCFAVAEKR